MNRMEVVATYLTIAEDVAQTLYDRHGVSGDGGGPIPVELWGALDNPPSPLILVDDRGGHDTVPIGNRNYDGIEIDSTSGAVEGQRLKFGYRGNTGFVVRADSQLKASRIAQALHDRLLRFLPQPERFEAAAPPEMEIASRQTTHEFALTSMKPLETMFQTAEDVVQVQVGTSILYTDVVLDPEPVPIDAIHTWYYDDGVYDEEVDGHTVVPDSVEPDYEWDDGDTDVTYQPPP